VTDARRRRPPGQPGGPPRWTAVARPANRSENCTDQVASRRSALLRSAGGFFFALAPL